MSLKELEMQVQQLPKPDLAKFSEWFDHFREAKVLTGEAPGDLEEAQQEEVLRRQAEYLANPRALLHGTTDFSTDCANNWPMHAASWKEGVGLFKAERYS